MTPREPRSELAKYALSYRKKKPSLGYWLIIIGMVIFDLGQMFEVYK